MQSKEIKVIKNCVMWFSILALFIVCQDYATMQRGYFAFGGEWLIFIIPAFIKAFKVIYEEGLF